MACAAGIREDVAPRIRAFVQRHGRPPGLGVVLAGRNAASEVYVRNKLKTVGDAGCRAELFRLDETATAEQALTMVRALNADETIDGILVQSPLPEGMGADAEQRVFDAVDPMKDVDGFHPHNVGLLVQKRPALVETVSDAKVKEAKAILRYSYDPPGRISWEQESGDVKSLVGHWEFTELGPERTEATYALRGDPGRMLGMLLRGPVVDKVKEALTKGAAEGLKAEAERRAG